MATIDDKVVAMSFENSKFESGVSTTLSTLDKLKAALRFDGASKGLDNLNKVGQNVDLSHIGKAVDDIKGKFGYLSVAALAVFADIARNAISTGAALVKSFTFEPIQAGLREYATNLNAVQTILANTQASGATLKDVNAALLELNKYSDQTIYNFSQMARNIGTFTAAGVDLKSATSAIKGIANLAALSGSNADQAATAMYQLSQAISAGRVGLQDWNSVVNAGMGGTVFQRALAQTAVSMGNLKASSLKLVGPMKNVSINGESFRQSMQAVNGKTWLTSDVLTKTLKQFTGDMTDAQLKAEGFSAAQIKAIQQTAKTAKLAATQVKTLSQVIDVAKETAGSGWAQTWQLIFGDFGEAKTLFTNVSNAVNGFINKSAEARNKVLGDWKALGGRTVLISAIKTAFEALGQIIKPIKEAFREIFPAKTGQDLMNLTNRFKELADRMKPSQETVDNLKRTFKGLFALLDIGKQIIGGIFTVFKELFSAVGGGSGGFLNFTANIGDFLVSIDKALKKGGAFHKFFVSLAGVLAIPIKLLKAVAEGISNLFSGFSPGGFSEVWDKFVESIGGSGNIINSTLVAITSLFAGLSTAITKGLSNIDFGVIFTGLSAGLLVGLGLLFKNFGKAVGGLGGGIVKNISSSFSSLSGSMKAMQQNIKAKTLKEIAIAIALLTASVVALSFVDSNKLKASITAMGFMFAELLGAMSIMEKIGKGAGFFKLHAIGIALILLAGAIDLLVISVLALSRLSWKELLKGLGGVGVLLGAIAAASIPLSANAGGMIRAGLGIIAIAVAMKILASAVADFGALSLSELSKGLAGVAVGLGVIVAAMKFMPKSLVVTGTGLIVVATGLKILADAVSKFGGMDWLTIGKGMTGIGGSLVVIAAAMRLMPRNTVIIASGLLLVAMSLKKIADAVAEMGGLSIREIAKGLITLAGALGILAAGLHLMTGTLAGSAALALAAGGLALFIPPLIALGKQSWKEIIKSLVTLGAALGILGVAGLLLAPTIPALLGLGAALTLIGAGLALAGVGIALIGTGLSAIAITGPAAVSVLIAALIQLIEAVPKMVKSAVQALLAIVQGLAAAAPQFVDAMVKILNSVLDVIIKSSPKMIEAFNALIGVILQVLQANSGKIIAAGFKLLMDLLQGIKDNISQLVKMGADIVVKFLEGLASNIGRIVTAGANLLVAFLKGIGDNLAKVVTAVFGIITKFITAVGTNLGGLAAAGLQVLTKFLSGIGTNLINVATAAGDVILRFIKGTGKFVNDVVRAGTDVLIKFISGLAKDVVDIAIATGQAIVNILKGLHKAVDIYAKPIRDEGWRLGVAILDGMTGGAISKSQHFYDTVIGIGKKGLGFMGWALGISSPSRITYKFGEDVIQGLINGLSAGAPGAYKVVSTLSSDIMRRWNDVFRSGASSGVMYDLGRFVVQGFAQGLRGSTDDIITAFSELNTKLTDAMKTSKDTIASEQAKLNDLLKAQKPDTEAIKKAQAVISQNQLILKESTAAHEILVTTLRKEGVELLKLSATYDQITARLTAAQDTLAAKIQERNDAIKGFSDQYSALPEIVTKDAEGNAIDQLATYESALVNQANAVAAYQSTLDQLRQLGLDDATYQKLLTEGTADQEFANQLLAGGRTAIEGLNVLDAQLAKVSKTLATNTANNLYQAGIDAAQGLVNGLKHSRDDIRKQMEAIAREMIAALKHELKAKSPSEEFALIGKYSMQGLAQGLLNSSNIVKDAIVDASNNALDAMRKSMRDISDIVSDELDVNPVITPILDLTSVRDRAKELAELTKDVPLTAAASFGQASIISSERVAAQGEEPAATPAGTSVTFEQNNYSPEALTEIEIYRNTRNQLSQLKSILAV